MKTILELTLLSLLLLVVASTEAAYAQQAPTGDSLDYFPYRAGDTWRIRNADTHEEFSTATILRDSVDSIGNLFLFASYVIKVDTAGDVIGDPTEPNPGLLYRLRAKVGDRWNLQPKNPLSISYVTCAAIYPENVFGEVRMVKEYHYWTDRSSSGGADSMWYSTRWLAQGFGEIRQFYDPDALHYVSGARVGDRTYGDMMPGAVSAASPAFAPLHVAPNPFTGGAIVRYHLDAREHVRLTLSDALGLTIAVPVDDVQDAGEHSAHIDGEGLPDGTYFYQLRTASHTYSGTLIRQR